MRLQEVTGSYEMSQRVREGCRVLQEVKRAYRGCKGLQRVTEGSKGF